MRRPQALESAIERRFVNEIVKLGCRTRKLNGFGARDWPDRLVLGPRGDFALVELKRLGKQATDRQATLHAALARLGHDVRTFDSWRTAVAYIRGKFGI